MLSGLEIHLGIESESKLFCPCLRSKETCAICRGQPGFLPQMPSRTVLQNVAKLLAVLKAKINPLVFYRKHYFYPDLPKGYQLTQHPDLPLATAAEIVLPFSGKLFHIQRIQLEQDPAAIGSAHFVMFSRAGNPLLQLTTTAEEIEPDRSFLRTITQLWYTLKQIAKDLQLHRTTTAILKIDVNLSLKGGPRIEVKNLSSLKDILTVYRTAQKFLNNYTGPSVTAKLQKGKIVPTRLKENYLFCRENNLPITSLPTVQPTLTKYDYLMTITDRTNNRNFSTILAKEALNLKLPLENRKIAQLKTLVERAPLNSIASLTLPVICKEDSFKTYSKKVRNYLRQSGKTSTLSNTAHQQLKQYFENNQ